MTSSLDSSASGSPGGARLDLFGSEPSSEGFWESGLRVGMRIGIYELVQHLGKGGMGHVFLARDTELDRPVAIKFLSSYTDDSAAMFLKEAKATARCHHENIVVIHQVSQHESQPYMVLEYLEGQTLRDWMNQQTTPSQRSVPDDRPWPVDPALPTPDLPTPGMDEPEGQSRRRAREATPESIQAAIEIMIPVVKALGYAHARGIVHRDLKPENVMLTDRSTIKVLDFGVAKVVKSEEEVLVGLPKGIDPSLTETGVFRGTVPYMSPEQLGADTVDHQSDLWAVGVILHQLVFGVHPLAPFKLRRMLEVRDLDQPMPSMTDKNALIGPIIDRCLAKRKSERFLSADALLEALEGLQAELKRELEPLPDTESPVDSKRVSKRNLSSAMAVGTVGLVALGVWSFGQESDFHVPPRSQVVLTRFVNQTSDPKLDGALDVAFKTGFHRSQHVDVLLPKKQRMVLERMNRAPDAVLDAELGREVAQRANASAVVTGRISSDEAGYQMVAEIVDPSTGRIVVTEEATAESREAVLDTLTAVIVRLRSRLGESFDDSVVGQPLLKVTTSDLEALRLYSEAIELYNQTRLKEAATRLQKAIERDPEFAMAHAMLGNIYQGPLADPERAVTHWKTALAHRDGLDELQALVVEGSMAWSGPPEEMERVWTLYATLRPDSPNGYGGLGYAYGRYLGRYAESSKSYKKYNELEPTIASNYHDIGQNHIALGEYDAAVEVINRGFVIDPQPLKGTLADAYLAMGRHQDALAHFETHQKTEQSAVASFPFIAALKTAVIHMDRGDTVAALEHLDAAEQHAQAMTSSAESMGFVLMTKVALLARMPNDAAFESVVSRLETELLGQLDAPDPILMNRPICKLALLGKLAVRRGDLERAKRLMKAIRPEVETHPNALWRAHQAMLEGELRFADGQSEAAISILQDGLAAVELFGLRESLAYVHLESKALQKARDALAWVVSHRGLAVAELQTEDARRGLQLLDWAEARLQLGMVERKLNNSSEADRHLNALSTQWASASPVFEPRQRLLGLLDSRSDP